MVTVATQGLHGQAQGTYRYQGRWQSIDHVLVSKASVPSVLMSATAISAASATTSP